MRRPLVHAGVWALTTGAAVTLTWFGVDAVLKGTVYDPPRAVPVSGVSPTWPGGEPEGTPAGDMASTARPDTTASAGSPDATASAAPAAREPATAAPSPTPTPEGEPAAAPPQTMASTLETVSVDGGRAVFDLGAESAELVSATPEPGWEMRVWKQDQWIRVTFSGDGRELSVFALWHDSAPRIELYEQ